MKPTIEYTETDSLDDNLYDGNSALHFQIERATEFGGQVSTVMIWTTTLVCQQTAQAQLVPQHLTKTTKTF